VLPSDIARTIIAVATALAITAIAVLLAMAVVRLARRRRVPIAVLRGLLISTGVVLGYLGLATDPAPGARLATVVASAALVLGVSWTRPATGGAALLAIAAQWVLYGGSFLLDNAIAGRRWAVGDIVPALIAGVVMLAGGLLLVVFGRGPERLRNPLPVQAAVPAERTFLAVSSMAVGPPILGMAIHDWAMLLTMAGVGWTTVALIRDRPFVEGAAIVTLAIGLATVLGSAAWVVVRRPRDRRSWEAFTWLGEWELDRYVAMVGGTPLPTAQDFRRWLRVNPDRPETRWIRYELLLMDGHIDEAGAIAAAMPADTPYERAERAAALAAVDWRRGGDGDPSAVRSAALDVLPADGDERLRVEVMVAIGSVREAIARAAADPGRPLRDVRDRLGTRADRVIWSALRVRVWPRFLRTAVMVVGVLVVLDRLVNPGGRP
jgi:hypothetical protein